MTWVKWQVISSFTKLTSTENHNRAWAKYALDWRSLQVTHILKHTSCTVYERYQSRAPIISVGGMGRLQDIVYGIFLKCYVSAFVFVSLLIMCTLAMVCYSSLCWICVSLGYYDWPSLGYVVTCLPGLAVCYSFVLSLYSFVAQITLVIWLPLS